MPLLDDGAVPDAVVLIPFEAFELLSELPLLALVVAMPEDVFLLASEPEVLA